MLVLGVGDSLRGSASIADKIDYSFHGYAGTAISLLAEGQLAVADGELYPAAAIAVVKSIVLVNTHTAAITVNLTILKSGSVARRLIPKDLSLGIGYSLYFEGSRFFVINASGEILTTAAGGTTIATDAIWDAAGDLLQGIGNDEGEVLSIGTVGQIPVVNAGATALAYEGGVWVTPAYDGANFTADASTWIVEEGDITTYAYILVGKTMTIAINILDAAAGGTPTKLYVKIPASKTATKKMDNACSLYENSAWQGGRMFVAAAATVITISTLVGDAMASGSIYVYGQITFEVN